MPTRNNKCMYWQTYYSGDKHLYGKLCIFIRLIGDSFNEVNNKDGELLINWVMINWLENMILVYENKHEVIWLV